MTCQDTKALLPEYQEGALPDGRRKDVEAHLSGCAPCGEVHDRTKHLDGFLRGAIRVPEPAGDFWIRQEAGILKASARPAATVRGRKGGSRLWFLGIGLGLAAAALVAVAVVLSTGTPSTPATPNREIAKHEDPPAASANVSDTRPGSVFSKSPVPSETAPVPSAPNAVLPGDPEYVERLANESVDVGLAQTLNDRLLGLINAASGRLRELKVAIATRKDVVAEDLAEAYGLIVREGISSMLRDPEESAQEVGDARAIARNYADSNLVSLKDLEAKAQGPLKTALLDALRATRELAGE